MKYTNETFIKKATEKYDNKYTYDKVNYINSQTKVCIICPEHGEFYVRPADYLRGYGCPKCQSSHLEEEIKSFLNDNDIEFEQQKTFEWLKLKNHLYLDFYLPKYNMAIECQGIQHFRPVDFFGGKEYFIKTIERDNIKQQLCENNGIKIIYFTNKSNCYDNSTIASLKDLGDYIGFDPE